MTADTLGGVLQYTEGLARGLAARGTTVFLATLGGPLRPAQRRAFAALFPSIRVFESGFALEWMREPWDEVDRAGHWLLDIAEKVEPDLVQVSGYSHGALRFPCPVVVVAHSCVLSWWRAVHDQPAPAEYDPYRERVGRGLLGADAIVAPSRAMARAIDEHYGAGKVTVIYNGRDPRAFAPEPKQPFVLSLGRVWDEAKNMTVLDEVAGDLPWPVRIAGAADPARPPRFAHAEYLGPKDGSALATLLARAAIYAHPARYEPFGLSILEAALSACALVIGDIPSLREIWGDCALYVKPDDRQAFREALKRLIVDDVFRRGMARRAKARASRYSQTRMTSRYLDLYRRMLQSRKNPQTSETTACS